MSFNNTIIKQSGYFAFLICRNEHVNYYKKYKWVKLNNKDIKVVDHSIFSNGMIFNSKKIFKKRVRVFCRTNTKLLLKENKDFWKLLLRNFVVSFHYSLDLLF